MWIRALQREGLYISPSAHLRSSLRPLRAVRILAVPTGQLSALVAHVLGDFGATVRTVSIKQGQPGRPLELESAHSREYLLNAARKSDLIISGCSLSELARQYVDVSSLRRFEKPPLYVHISEPATLASSSSGTAAPSAEISFMATHAACALVAHLYCHIHDGTAGHELTIKPEDHKTFLESLQ